jgi:hypothetical protein
MRAISLWQPWASLVAIGAKRIETRHWPVPQHILGQRIAIHAAKRWTQEEAALLTQEPFRSVLERNFGIMAEDTRLFREVLPFGAVIATATLTECLSTNGTRRDGPKYADWVHNLSVTEEAFGNYGPDRFGWVLQNIIALPEPIPFKGAQGFFEAPL